MRKVSAEKRPASWRRYDSSFCDKCQLSVQEHPRCYTCGALVGKEHIEKGLYSVILPRSKEPGSGVKEHPVCSTCFQNIKKSPVWRDRCSWAEFLRGQPRTVRL